MEVIKGAKNGVAFKFVIPLTDSANRPDYKAGPTLAAGDVKVARYTSSAWSVANINSLPVAITGLTTHLEVSLTATEMTADDDTRPIIVSFIDAAGGEWDDNTVEIRLGAVEADMTKINGDATDGNNAILKLKALDIQSDSQAAITAKVTAGTGAPGIDVSGYSAFPGIRSNGGADGAGAQFNGGTCAAQHGIEANGGNGGDGIRGNGDGAGAGIGGQGGASGAGGRLSGGASAGLRVTSGINFAAVDLVGAGSGAALKMTGGPTGHALHALGGSSSGNAFHLAAQGSGQSALEAVGVGFGSAFRLYGGAGGDALQCIGSGSGGRGIMAKSQGASSPGVEFIGNSAGAGFKMTGGGIGKDIDAAEIDAILTDTNEVQGKLPTNNIMGSSDKTDKDDEINAIKAVTDNLPNSGALTDIDTGVNNIEAKLPTNYIMGSGVQSDKDDEIDAILVDTGTTIPGLIGAPGVDLATDIADVQTSVDGISNSTRLTASIAAHYIVPAAGSAYHYVQVALKDANGNMEDPDSNDLGIRLTGSQSGTITGRLYKTSGGAVLGASGVALCDYKLERDGVGLYRMWYKSTSGDTNETLAFRFGWAESAVVLYEQRGSQTLDADPGTTTLADSAANKDIIAEALKERDVSGTGAVSGSVYDDIMDNVDGVQTTADAIEVDTQDLQTQIGTAGAGLTDLGGMSTVMKAEVEAEATDALNAYDPPTKAELDTAEANIIAEVDANETKIDAVKVDTAAILVDTGTTIPAQIFGLNDLSQAEAEAACDAALATYDAPTKSELDAAEAAIIAEVDANETKIDAVKVDTAAILVDTGTTLPAQIAALNNLSQAEAEAACDAALATYDAPTHAELKTEMNEKLYDQDVLTRHGNDKPATFHVGSGADRIKVTTTQDGAGNTDTQAYAADPV